MNPRKKKRIEEMLRRELSSIILYEMSDPRTGFVTLTGVELKEDQRSAKVRVILRGTDQEKRQTMRALRHARGYVQSLVGQRLKLRYTPKLDFTEDAEVLNAMRMDKLIDQVRKEDRDISSSL